MKTDLQAAISNKSITLGAGGTVSPPPPTSGPNLITNGTFTTDAAGWTGTAGASVSVANGELVVTGASGQAAYRAIAAVNVEAGKTYDLKAKGRIGTNALNWILRLTPSNAGSGTGALYNSTEQTNSGTMAEVTHEFVCTTTETLYVTLACGKNSTGTSEVFFDDVSMAARA